MIEKWRPAKAGDVGIVRVCHATNEWQLMVARQIELESNHVFVNGFLWKRCEVLVAYLDDAEIEALADGLAAGIKPFKDLCADAICKHFERGE